MFFSFHLACISTLRWGRAETKRISIIPVYPCTVLFNISGMSAFVFFVLCYSKNSRFAISSQGWAPGESAMSKGSPRQHPSQPTQSPPQPWAEEPGHRSQQTIHSARTPMRHFCTKLHKLWPFLIFVRSKWTLFRKLITMSEIPSSVSQ